MEQYGLTLSALLIAPLVSQQMCPQATLSGTVFSED